jgi:hypothetical protein
MAIFLASLLSSQGRGGASLEIFEEETSVLGVQTVYALAFEVLNLE